MTDAAAAPAAGYTTHQSVQEHIQECELDSLKATACTPQQLHNQHAYNEAGMVFVLIPMHHNHGTDLLLPTWAEGSACCSVGSRRSAESLLTCWSCSCCGLNPTQPVLMPKHLCRTAAAAITLASNTMPEHHNQRC